jgi:hypothetical protein
MSLAVAAPMSPTEVACALLLIGGAATVLFLGPCPIRKTEAFA